jgi:hypothetical protein
MTILATPPASNRKRSRQHVALPPDFNDPEAQDKLADTHIALAVTGVGASTWARYISEKRITPVKIGKLNKFTYRTLKRIAAEGIPAAA